MFSAAWSSYLAAPQQNWLWGWTAWGFSGNERHLFPGFAAVALAALGLAWTPRRLPLIYLALTMLAVELSLGLNGTFYRWLYDHTFAFRGFRAPARFAILACCAMSVLAGFGYQCAAALLASRPAAPLRPGDRAGRDRRRVRIVAARARGAADNRAAGLQIPADAARDRSSSSFPFVDYDPTYMFWSRLSLALAGQRLQRLHARRTTWIPRR